MMKVSDAKKSLEDVGYLVEQTGSALLVRERPNTFPTKLGTYGVNAVSDRSVRTLIRKKIK